MKKNEKKLKKTLEGELRNFEIGEVDFGHKSSQDTNMRDNFVNSGLTGPQKDTHQGLFDKTRNISSDQAIANDITDCLRSSFDTDKTDIVFAVEKGVVYLTGRVDDEKIKKRIESLIRQLPNVRTITNELSVYHAHSRFIGPDNMTKKDLGLS